MALNSLSEYCGLNLSGLITLQYASLDMIDRASYIPIFSSGNLLYNILFTQGSWLTLPARPGSPDWSQTENRSEQGPFYDQRLQAVLPHMRIEVEAELERMSQHAYLLRMTDRNGKVWLLGTPDHPFYFKADSATGDSAGFNNYPVLFESQTPWRATGFTPSFQV